MEIEVTDEMVRRVWAVQGWGAVEDVEVLGGGVINQARVVNGEWVIRFDTFELAEPHRYYGEQMVYARLAVVGVLVPKVRLVDTGKAVIPFHYMVMSRMEGETLAAAWPGLTKEQREKIAYAAGQLLAQMHSVMFEKLGWVRRFPDNASPTWFEVMEDYLERYAQRALKDSLIESSLYERMRRLLEQVRPDLEAVRTGHLLHSDFHSQNILQKEGAITGVIDFEWAVSGDPTYDLAFVELWDEYEPWEAATVLAGYRSLRPFAPNHERTIGVYKVIMLMDSVVFVADNAERLPRTLERLEETVMEAEMMSANGLSDEPETGGTNEVADEVETRKGLKYTLEELLEGVMDENIHEEIDTGPPQGKEIW